MSFSAIWPRTTIHSELSHLAKLAIWLREPKKKGGGANDPQPFGPLLSQMAKMAKNGRGGNGATEFIIIIIIYYYQCYYYYYYYYIL